MATKKQFWKRIIPSSKKNHFGWTIICIDDIHVYSSEGFNLLLIFRVSFFRFKRKGMNRILDQALSVISSVIIPNVGNDKENFLPKICKYNHLLKSTVDSDLMSKHFILNFLGVRDMPSSWNPIYMSQTKWTARLYILLQWKWDEFGKFELWTLSIRHWTISID